MTSEHKVYGTVGRIRDLDLRRSSELVQAAMREISSPQDDIMDTGYIQSVSGPTALGMLADRICFKVSQPCACTCQSVQLSCIISSLWYHYHRRRPGAGVVHEQYLTIYL